MKNVIVIGSSGYIGQALVQRLIFSGNYNVLGIDNDSKANLVDSLSTQSLIPIKTCMWKAKEFTKSERFHFEFLDIVQQPEKLNEVIKKFQPETIINLAQQPSGPFSQISQGHSSFTLMNNMIGTNNVIWAIKEYVPECHYVTISTMGTYDHTIGTDIPEGYFCFDYEGKCSKESIFPRRPGSFYHLSKVASTYLVDMCSRLWNIKATDIMQGVVYGIFTPEIDQTKIFSSFFVDECFGTVINRFIAQAILKKPLTVFGEGLHSRGFISLNDSIQALMIAIENTPIEKNKPRTWNQLSEWKKITEVAEIVQKVANETFNLDATIEHIDSPRKENTSDHYYNICTDTLKSLGYIPTRTIEQEVTYCIEKLLENQKYIKKFTWDLDPKVQF